MVKENYPIKARTKQGMAKVLCVLSALALPLTATAAVEAVPNAEQNLEFSAATPVKSYKIVGAVVDSKTKESVIGASVLIKGTTHGTVTDYDGKFELEVKKGDVLVISYMGYTTKTIRVKGQKVVSVTLSEDAKALGEVVVTAFGTGQKKETVSGSIQTVRPSDLKIPTSNLSSAFAGRLSGVIAQQKSGQPGQSNSEFYIRGIATLSKVNKPLIIIDGVEMSQEALDALDPEVIDSFSVLKDATASAMYGTRGANGVMIIKTKSGADLERAIIGFRVETSMNMPTQMPELADAVTFMNMFNEGRRNQGNRDFYSAEKIRGTELGMDPIIYPNVDWYKELFREQTFNQRANFNIRGGTSKITYFMNVNAVHESGMLRGRSKEFHSFDNSINNMRYAFQNNVDFHLTPQSKIGLHLNVNLENYKGPLTANGGNDLDGVFRSVMDINPVDFPILYEQGDDEWIHWGGTSKIGNATTKNPLAEATAGYQERFKANVVANIDFEQKLDFITKGLSFKALFSFTNFTESGTKRYLGYNMYLLDGATKDPNGQWVYTQAPVGTPKKHTLQFKTDGKGNNRYYLQAYFNYDRSFGDHNISGMLLYNQDEHNIIKRDYKKKTFEALPYRKLGLAFRATYDYARRYMLEFNAGYNGSENFAEGHRFGFFPSISAAWNVSQEDFWEPIKDVVNNFKIRASYGLVGNDQIGGDRFIYRPILVPHEDKTEFITGFGDNMSQKRKGPIYTRFRNDDITWEVGHKLNVGLDLKFFKSLGLTVDLFQEIRSNIFQERKSVPKFLGAADTKIFGNFAKVKNQGIDLSIDYGKQFNKDLAVQFKGTFTYAHNKVLEYDEPVNTRPALSLIGKTLKTDKGYVADGLFIDEADIQNNPTSTLGNMAIAPGDIKYIDQPDKAGNYDGQITDEDQVFMEHPYVPEIIYGFGPTVTYKNWDFGCFFQGQANVTIMMRKFHPFGDNIRRNVLKFVADDYWARNHQNIDAAYPRLTQKDNDNNNVYSTYWARNAAFLKLKSAEIGYSFKGARVYLSATNLFTISPFKHWDPAVGGGSGLKYPLQRTFNLGLQVTFK